MMVWGGGLDTLGECGLLHGLVWVSLWYEFGYCLKLSRCRKGENREIKSWNKCFSIDRLETRRIHKENTENGNFAVNMNYDNRESQSEQSDSDLPDSCEELTVKHKEPRPLWEREIVAVPVDKVWPAPVSCNMNIPIWDELMRAVGLERDIPYITEGFKEGFCLGIPQHNIEGLKWYTPDNHKSALSARN